MVVIGWDHQRQQASNSIPRNTLYASLLDFIQWPVLEEHPRAFTIVFPNFLLHHLSARVTRLPEFRILQGLDCLPLLSSQACTVSTITYGHQYRPDIPFGKPILSLH